MDFIVSALLGAWLMLVYLERGNKNVGLLPQFTVQKIGSEWVVNNLVKGLSPEDRDQVITLLLEEIDKLDHGTQYDLDS